MFLTSIISSTCFLARSLFAPFALDGTEDDAVWDDEEEEAEDAEEPIDNEFETDSEGTDDE